MLRNHLIRVALSISVLVPIPMTSRASQGAATAVSHPSSQTDADRMDGAQLVVLKGNTHPLARAEFDQGAVSPSLQMKSMLLLLKRDPTQQAALDRLLAEQQDPTSPNYHAWLSPAAMGQKYGPAEADVSLVTGWLRAQGFSVDRVSNSRTVIEFSGDASHVRAAFHTEIHSLNVHGVKHIANMSDPSIPAALATVVAGVQSLNDFFAKPLHVTKGVARFDAPTGRWMSSTGTTAGTMTRPAKATESPIPTFTGDLPRAAQNAAKPEFGIVDAADAQLELVSPYDFAAIYNVLPLWSAVPAIDGTGQTIAIAGTSNIVPSDVASFRSFFGLAANAPTVIVTNTDPGTSSADSLLENSLDVEWSGAVAKGAAIKLVTSSATATTDALSLSEEYIVDNDVAPVMSVSYGECELALGTSGNLFLSTLWQQAQAEGIAVFVAAGDEGSAMCDSDIDTTPAAAEYGLAVNGFASTPYDVAVGGTDLNWYGRQSTYWGTSNSSTEANALGYIPEMPWNDTCTNPAVIGIIYPGHTAEQTCNAAARSSSDASLVTVEGGGGGSSACVTSNGSTLASCAGGYAKPAWQSGVTGIVADGARDLPDVSLFAAPGLFGSAYPVCVSSQSPDGTCNFSNATDIEYLIVGGTSASSPAMAGVMALINQRAATPQGNPNAEFYTLASQQVYSNCSAEAATVSSQCYFNDIDTGTIAMPCYDGTTSCTVSSGNDLYGVQTGWSAGVGYDLATGLGSLNVANVVDGWPVSLPVVALSVSSLKFSATPVQTSAATQTITLSNTGTGALAISSIAISGTNATSFKESSNCPTRLAAGTDCFITVTFTPLAPGSLSASLNLVDNATGSPQTVTLSGTGTGATASLSPVSYVFANTRVGTVSAFPSFTLTNTGNASLTVSSITPTGSNASSFLIPSDHQLCTTVAAGASCSFVIAFSPTAVGTVSASIQVADNAVGSPQSIAVSGTGMGAAAAVSPTSYVFANTRVGTISAFPSFTLTNTGNWPLTVSSITSTGSNASSFFIPSDHQLCTTVAAGASCTFDIAFEPTAVGSLSASIQITDNAAVGSIQTVAVSGTGLASSAVAGFSVTSIAFPPTVSGSKVLPAQAVTLTNTGIAPLTVSSIGLTGTGTAGFTQLNNCPGSIAVGASCLVLVQFAPPVTGNFAANLSITDNAPQSPQTVALTGTGGSTLTASLSQTAISFAATAAGTTSAETEVLLSNTGNTTLFLTGLALGGSAPQQFQFLSNCGAQLAPGSSCAIMAVFTPTAAGTFTATLTATAANPAASYAIALSGTGH